MISSEFRAFGWGTVVTGDCFLSLDTCKLKFGHFSGLLVIGDPAAWALGTIPGFKALPALGNGKACF